MNFDSFIFSDRTVLPVHFFRPHSFTFCQDRPWQKKIINAVIWFVALCNESSLRKKEIRRIVAMEMWIWRRMECISWTEKITNKEILWRVERKQTIDHCWHNSSEKEKLHRAYNERGRADERSYGEEKRGQEGPHRMRIRLVWLTSWLRMNGMEISREGPKIRKEEEFGYQRPIVW